MYSLDIPFFLFYFSSFIFPNFFNVAIERLTRVLDMEFCYFLPLYYEISFFNLLLLFFYCGAASTGFLADVVSCTVRLIWP